MTALPFAWRSLTRQPARAALAVLGVAAVGALLFDMLLLSNGLVVSMRDVLERSGYDLRVAIGDRPGVGPLMPEGAALADRIAALPSVASVVTLRDADADIEHGGRRLRMSFEGIGGNGRPPWRVIRGSDLSASGTLVVNENAAQALGVAPGDSVIVRASCTDAQVSLPPVRVRVAGVVAFPFQDAQTPQAATSAAGLAAACGEDRARAVNVILVTSAGTPEAAAAAIMRLDPAVRALTNQQAVSRMEQSGFTYFRQISAVLTTVTVMFALLLIAVLLTVSVNQRLGTVAALRALGFSRRRVVADVLCESALIVGTGGVLSLPLGLALASWLDAILKGMPGIPADLHFFVFEPGALAVHAGLLAATAILAAAYPMRIVARLPIAATLRNEVVS